MVGTWTRTSSMLHSTPSSPSTLLKTRAKSIRQHIKTVPTPRCDEGHEWSLSFQPESGIWIELREVLCTCSFPKVRSTDGREWFSCWTYSFLLNSLVKSTHTLTSLLSLVVTTMVAHHSVRWSTGDITRLSNILAILCVVSSYSDVGTFFGTVSANGFASSFSLMVYSSVIVPSPSNSDG